MEDQRYPLGPFKRPKSLDGAQRTELIDKIAAVPALMREAVKGLKAAQLDTPYRPDGWTVRQVVHHVVDSHLNSYVRWRWTLTEDEPTIKGYDEKAWAELDDGRNADPEVSLRLLDSLHERWVLLLRSLTAADFARRLKHPEFGSMSLDELLALYAWHGHHHVAHVTALRQREGW